MALLEVEKISCTYGDGPALNDFSFEVVQGEIAALLGPSGGGKTTTLRAILGFEPILEGEIRIAGEVMSRPGFNVPPERRPVGMVFQDRALFPHLTVEQNIAIGIRREPKTDQDRIVRNLLEIVGLEHCISRFPHELSGGQQERVALARALAPQPRLLLLDEPFASLDIDLRERLSFDVRNILKETGSTAVVVTHYQDEAFAMGDQVGIIEDGAILQWDTAVQHLPSPGLPTSREPCRPRSLYRGYPARSGGLLIPKSAGFKTNTTPIRIPREHAWTFCCARMTY